MNEIQLLGSHNSYKQAMDPELFAQFAKRNPKLAMTLEYSNVSLTEQLDFGLRVLELDVFFDPEGGRYATPLGLTSIKNPSEYDPAGIMETTGFKVLHVQDIDFRSSCLTFQMCLEELRQWSERNPGHLPVMVSINAKDQVIELPGFVKPLKFDAQAWHTLDAELLSVLGDKIILPEEIQGEAENLNEAITTIGWPAISVLASRFLFVLDEPIEKGTQYLHDSKNPVLFVNLPAGNAHSAIRIINNPIEDMEEIQSSVKQGYLVRTRADADTNEARNEDFSRREAAWESGAHFVSTDYYAPPTYFSSDYLVELKPIVETGDDRISDKFFRCNPVTAESSCVSRSAASE